MAGTSGKDAVLLIAEYDLTAKLNEMEITHTCGAEDSTVYEPSGDAEAFTATLQGWTVRHRGFYAGGGTATDLDEVVHNQFGSANPLFLACPVGDATDSAGRAGYVVQLNSAIATPVAGLVTQDTNLSGDGPIDVVTLLHSRADAESTSGANEGDTIDFGAATTGARCYLFITDVSGSSGSTVDVKVQDGTDGANWADLVTFTQATDATSELKTDTGAVNRYLRAHWTLTGTNAAATFALAAAVDTGSG